MHSKSFIYPGYVRGPLSVLQRCVTERLLIQVWIRSAVDLRGMCKGYLVAFDKHFNLVCTFCIISHVPRKQWNKKNCSQLINDQNLKGLWFKSNPVRLCTYYYFRHILAGNDWCWWTLQMPHSKRSSAAQRQQGTCMYILKLATSTKIHCNHILRKRLSDIGSCNTVYKTWFMIILLRNLSHR